ncbi:MAG: purine-binding chemotaxis protein CheW [Nitrospirae bacterium]|nr:MAG: purine-binding chemotaxis protein CheW [Nitrospirota bacterium]
MSNAENKVPQTVQPGAVAARPAASLRVCLISLGGESFAIDLRHVREVFEVDNLTVVPGMPSALTGVANLRGVVIPVVDLRSLLGLPISGTKLPFAVVLKHGTHQVGVLVEQVPEIRTVHQEDFLPAPSRGVQGPTPFVNAILKMDDRIGGVVEVPTLLSYVESGTAQPQS